MCIGWVGRTEVGGEGEGLGVAAACVHPIVEGRSGEETRTGAVRGEKLLVVGEDLWEEEEMGGWVGGRGRGRRAGWEKKRKRSCFSVGGWVGGWVGYLRVEEGGDDVFRRGIDSPLLIEALLLGSEISGREGGGRGDGEGRTPFENGFLDLLSGWVGG